MSVLAWVLSAPIHLYRKAVSPLFPNACRYQPTCSAYALEALKCHGALRGLLLATRRLLRCHPWGGHGYDPVPKNEDQQAPCGHREGFHHH